MLTDKIVTLPVLLKKLDHLRQSGKRIVSTNGCFDILHVGHIRNLEEARKFGDVLVVGVNSDASVKENKGDIRPIVPEAERAEMLAALGSVDYVFIFEEQTPFSWIRQIRPHVHVKGGGEDILTNPLVKVQQEIVESVGGAFVLVPHHEGHSTSGIIEKITQAGA